VFIEAKDDGGGSDNLITGATSRAKLQSNHHHQQINIQFFYRPDALPVAHPWGFRSAIPGVRHSGGPLGLTVTLTLTLP